MLISLCPEGGLGNVSSDLKTKNNQEKELHTPRSMGTSLGLPENMERSQRATKSKIELVKFHLGGLS